MIDQIGASVGSSNDGVMTLRALAGMLVGTASRQLVAPSGIGAEDVDAAVAVVLLGAEVEQIRRIEGVAVLAVHIGTVGVLGTEDAHLVATIVIVVGSTAGSQSAIGDEEEVVATDVFDVAGLARGVVATGNLLAIIGVDGDAVATACQGISDVVVAQTGFLVKFEHVDAAAPRAIRHPKLARLIVEHAGVYAVRIALAPFVADTVATGQRGLGADGQFQVGLFV